MLVAECHGKSRAEVEHDEDYLTSAVFGHLRYVCPPLFWRSFLMMAKASDFSETSLYDTMRKASIDFDLYDTIQVKFWPYGAGLGEPDLLIQFGGSNVPPVLIMVEVKLWAGKSGEGKKDQLWRYLQLLDRISKKDRAGFSALVYLTPRDSLAEIQESLLHVTDRQQYLHRLFRVKWQDVQGVARNSIDQSEGSDKIILRDVETFLKRRGLEYFSGFAFSNSIPALNGGEFYRSAGVRLFTGMTFGSCPDRFPSQRAGWIK